MSKTRKRQTCRLEVDAPKSAKKCKKATEKVGANAGTGSKSSDADFGVPNDSSMNEVNSSKRQRSRNTSELEIKTHKSVALYNANDLKSLNISQLLDLGEGKYCETQIANVSCDVGGPSDSDEAEDWEEVKMEEHVDVKDPVIPKEGINITLEVPGLNALKKKKKGFDLEAHIKRQINQVKRELQLLMHKVHVLCWIAHLKFVNTILNSETLMGVGLSLVSSMNLYPPKYADLGYLERIIKWFHSVIELKEFLKNPVRNKELLDQLCHEFGIKTAYSKKHYVLMLIVLLRTLGLKVRVVMSFQVVPIRPTNTELNNIFNKGGESGKKNCEQTKDCSSKTLEDEFQIIKIENNYFSRQRRQDSELCILRKKGEPSTINETTFSNKNGKRVKRIVKSENGVKDDVKKLKERGKSVQEESDHDNGETSKHFRSCDWKKSLKATPAAKGRQRKGIPAEKKVITKQNEKNKRIKKASMTPERKNKIIEKATRSSDTDSDFVPLSLKKKTSESEIDRKVFSSDEEEESMKKQGVNVWAEVFLEAEEKWIAVDAVRQKIHCVNELYGRATHPVAYIVACNNDSTLKDVTKRYVPNWHSDARKRRVDDEWWNETMWPYMGPKTVQDREEDEDINKQLLDKPLPAAIAEYKDHPLYALKRHLLKFEGIYPPEAPTLGFIRGEPVYARECVVTLRSREVWYKEARLVRLGEQPYKIVKARPKYDKMTGEIKKDLPLELFGLWQTENYIPPIATDGKVPRNEYGNVDLFKPCMLPKGTVHLQIPAINKTAKKLGIDCAAAVVGFEFHSGASHPIIDGFVVCEEFKDVLLDAWNKEMDISNKKNVEKTLKRIYGNWKRLIRGLLIREKLKIKYDFGGGSSDSKASKSETAGKPLRKKAE